MSQLSIPCSVYRGGTSRGVFFNKRDLPENIELQKKLFMAGIDAYNPSQIDGLGSGTSHTSKVCVISKSEVNGADVDYTFYQVGIGKEIVDDKGTCGNLMAAVGAFAVDEGYIAVDSSVDNVEVSVFNTNIKKMLKIKVPVINGNAKVSGDYLMPGINKPGAKFSVSILTPGGGKTGSTQPLGDRYTLNTKTKVYEVSFVDIVNPFVFVSSHDLGIEGTELNAELSLKKSLLEELEEIRTEMAVKSGLCRTIEEARQFPSVPKIAIVSEPMDYITSSGKLIKQDEVDVVARMLSMGKFHRTFAGSGLYNIAGAAILSGTIPNQYAKQMYGNEERVIRIGHPEGIAKVRIALTEDGRDVRYVGIDRTARRIMKGDLFIPE
ncbi:PrpF domain-containing protein [Lysinibacillus sp. NPDC097287]|uniref:PrpF domain-containing protein n=1 Tax=Lysinibacillus sp. NPDC097287 TaxID=3364144 RepID=UPI0038124D6C